MNQPRGARGKTGEDNGKGKGRGKGQSRNRAGYLPPFPLLPRGLFLLCLLSLPAFAQPTAQPQIDALTQLVLVAGQMIPRMQQAVESPLVRGLENLAFWLAVIVMLFSFARMLRENDGASKDFFWWCFRLAVIFSLFGTGRTLINNWSQLGYDIVNVTDFRKVFWDAELEFEVNYEQFIEGLFLVQGTNVTDAIAALTTDDVNLRNIANAANPAAWSLPNLFLGVTVARGILQFAQLFLALLGALITLALRLFAPFAIALAIDRNLAQRISYPFAWSAAVFTMVTPLVSHILGFIVYFVGNMALTIIKPESAIFRLDANGAILGDPNVVSPAASACLVLIVLMIIGALLLLASPYLSYKLAFGQIFEAVSTTASGWMGALTATGIEIAGVSYGSALQRQASETRLEGQAQSETARASAGKEASDLSARAQQLVGLQSATASRSQALGTIAGGYQMALRMNEAQRQASTGMIEQSRRQQVSNLDAERSFGQTQANLQAGREARDLRISQSQQNITTLAQRTFDVADHTTGALSRLGGESLPLLPAAGEAAKLVTGPVRGAAEISINNTTTDARVSSMQLAAQGSSENYAFTTQLREHAANGYAAEATRLTNEQAAANNAAASVQRDLAAGGVQTAYQQQVHGVNGAYQLSVQANQVNLDGALQAAQIMKESGMNAVKLEQVSQIVHTLSRDMARRAELAMTLRY